MGDLDFEELRLIGERVRSLQSIPDEALALTELNQSNAQVLQRNPQMDFDPISFLVEG